uniref:Uncharacterized protein n=1 Tax=Arundo donax TaxID=35708 RepID=A0A0A9DDD7_ARUDO
MAPSKKALLWFPYRSMGSTFSNRCGNWMKPVLSPSLESSMKHIAARRYCELLM